MKAILDDKLYDTEKADLLYTFRRKVQGSPVLWNPGYYYTEHHDFEMYRTKKNAYFTVDQTDKILTSSSEEEAKKICRRIDPDMYIELFGEVEEA